MNRPLLYMMAFLAFINLSGCGTNQYLYNHYLSFLENPNNKDLQTLDKGGEEGARLIISILEYNSSWKMAKDNQGRQCIALHSFTKMPISVIDGVFVTKTHDVFDPVFTLYNSYLLYWANNTKKP